MPIEPIDNPYRVLRTQKSRSVRRVERREPDEHEEKPLESDIEMNENDSKNPDSGNPENSPKADKDLPDDSPKSKLDIRI